MDWSPKGVNRATAIVKVILKNKGHIIARADEMQALLKNYTASHCRKY